MTLTIIAAVDSEGGFGLNGKIPWHYPEDFKHFKEKTTGKVCVMGRITYEDMVNMAISDGRPIDKGVLPNRKCYVITSNKQFGVVGEDKCVDSVEEVQEMHKNEEIILLGGETLFNQYIDVADSVWLTAIDKVYNCDRFFPTDKLDNFKILEGNKVITKSGDKLYFVHYAANRK
jgi:dihydrofolate reductase